MEDEDGDEKANVITEEEQLLPREIRIVSTSGRVQVTIRIGCQNRAGYVLRRTVPGWHSGNDPSSRGGAPGVDVSRSH